MIKQRRYDTDLESLLELLANKDAVIRQKARQSLVVMGKSAVPSLAGALKNSMVDHVRWEAAKALGAIGDSRAIPSLVKALGDSDQDVVWLAAEALSRFKKTAWPQLLHALIISEPDSVLLRKGAHHVLQSQKEEGFNDLLAILRTALESSTGSESTPFAASDMLKRLKVKS